MTTPNERMARMSKSFEKNRSVLTGPPRGDSVLSPDFGGAHLAGYKSMSVSDFVVDGAELVKEQAKVPITGKYIRDPNDHTVRSITTMRFHS